MRQPARATRSALGWSRSSHCCFQSAQSSTAESQHSVSVAEEVKCFRELCVCRGRNCMSGHMYFCWHCRHDCTHHNCVALDVVHGCCDARLTVLESTLSAAQGCQGIWHIDASSSGDCLIICSTRYAIKSGHSQCCACLLCLFPSSQTTCIHLLATSRLQESLTL